MSLDEVIEHAGAHVIYTHPATGVKERGVICRASSTIRDLVYVYYGENSQPLATHPANLELDRRRR